MLHNIVQGLANAQIANIMTIVFVALMFISVIWGILRGFKKSVFYTIFYVIACAVLFISLDKIATLALSLDISSFGLVVNGVKMVTLGDSVPELLRSILSQGNGADLSTMFVKGTESYVLVNTVLGSMVQFVFVLAFVLLFQTVYKLLVWILWLIIGKPFDKRKVRVRGKLIKKPKNATGGALVGFIPGLISVVMLFVPLSGVFSIAQSVTRVEVKNGVSFGDYLNEEDYYLLQQVLGQYEESVPGKLFNIKTSEDGRSLDLWLLDKCITVEVDGNKFNIREDIENMGEFASNMAATGLLDVMLDGDATTYDLVNVVDKNEDKIVKAFTSLGDIELIDLLLNTGIEYLDCSRIIDSTLELSSDSINYENLAKLDWSKELAQIGNIFISAVDILSLVPNSSLSSPTIELDKIDLDKLNNDDILENFVNELFESNIINESATAGLAYVLGIDNVKEIVGEFDKEELKNVDLKADLLRVVEATKSILNIGFNNLKNVDLKELSNKSQDLKVIVDELLSMEIFALVEENVIDYAITNYVETNENIKKFVDIEELRKLRLVDFKRELGAVIDTFGRLGEETKLFELDGAENILMEKLNMDAFNSNALRIIVDHIDGSTTIQDFMDKILRGALVPSIFDEEKYNDLITKENFKWSNELYVLVDLLKEIETNNSDFNIYVMATSEEKEITVGMLKGLYGVDENNEFIIDKSIFVEEMMVSIINKATEGNDFEGVFDDVDSLGVEIKVLTEMMIDAGIVEDRNDYVVDFANISNEFDGINLKMLRSICTHIGDSNILRSIINSKITDFKVNDKEVIDTSDWDANKYTEEFTVLYEVLEASGKIDEEEKTPFNELGNLFSDSIPLAMLEEVSNEVGHSEILQNTMKIALEEQFTNTDFDSWSNEDWTNETKSLYNIINDGELYTIDSEGDKVIDLNELTNIDEIKVVSICAFKDNIKNSSLIQNVMKDNLDSIMGEDYDYSSWNGNKWEDEMTALYNVSKTISSINDKGEEVISFDDFEDMSEIKMTTIEACKDNIKNSEMIQKLMKDNLGSVMGEDYDYSSWDGNKWEVEMTALYNISGTMATKNTNNEDVINFDDFEDMSEIKMTTVEACKDNIEYSEMIQKLMKDNLDPVMGEGYDYSSWDGGKWRVEMTALYNVSGTMSTKNANGESVINFDDFEDMSEIKMTTVAACRDNINGSEMIQKVMEDNLDPVMGEGYDYSSWTGDKWEDEMTALYNVSETMSTKNAKDEDVINFDDFEDMSEIKMTTIGACRDNIENSEMIQDLMKDNLGSIMGDDYDYSSWDGNKWKVEMTSLYEISDTIKTKNTKNEYIIDLSSDLVGTEVKLITIEAVSNNSHSDIIRNCMQDTINDLLVIDNAPTLTCNPTNTYSGWDDAQWEYELYVLDVISTELSTDGVTIDTSNMADSLNSIEVSFFNELTNLVYGNKNGGSNKYNSYILQAQLTSAIESIMNTGFNSSDARYRFLHPTSVSSVVNYTNNVPEYSDFSIAEDSSVGVWWSNELRALYNLLVAMYGENGTIAALDNIELNSVTIATLNAIRDNIRSSYVLQSSMRATIEDVMNGDLSNGSVSVTEMCTEFYSGETWKEEIAAIRNVAKTVSTYTGGGTLTYSYSLNSYNNFKYDGSNDGIMIENLDKYYEIDLNSIDLGDELKVETLYYATFYADRSNVIRSLLRVSIAEILGENNDDFVEYWLNYSNANGGIYDSFYNNRWTYEMEALFNVSSKLAKDGKIDLSGSMLNKIPVALFDEINGAFTSDNVIDESNIISGLKDHGYVANYQKGSTEYEFASEIIRSLLKDSLASTDGIVNPSSWSDEQWAYEVHAISKVSSLLAVNNELDISTISFDGGIKAELLVIIPKIIDKATFLQHKLKPELENLVDSSMFTRSTIRADYGNSFELEVNYGDVDYAWRVELATVFGIITYDDGTLSSGLVDSNGIVAIIDVQEKLEQLNIDIIKIAAMLLKEKSNTLYTYNTSRIVRLNLIAPLEEMSECVDVTYSGITPSDLPFITNVNAFPPFEWINDGSNTTDLEELYGFFELLGATNVTEAIEELENINEFDPRIVQIISLAENSFFLTVVVNNQILNP